jgi:hypothetical protein
VVIVVGLLLILKRCPPVSLTYKAGIALVLGVVRPGHWLARLDRDILLLFTPFKAASQDAFHELPYGPVPALLA